MKKHELKLRWLACGLLGAIILNGCGPSPAQVKTPKPTDSMWIGRCMEHCIVTIHYYPPNGKMETYENVVIKFVGGEYGTVWFKDSKGKRLCVHGSYKVELDPIQTQ